MLSQGQSQEWRSSTRKVQHVGKSQGKEQCPQSVPTLAGVLATKCLHS